MRPVEVQTGVIDRIVDRRQAVILAGDDQREVVVPVSALPPGADEGSHLKLQMVDGKVSSIELNDNATEAAQERVRGKLDQLQKKGRKLG